MDNILITCTGCRKPLRVSAAVQGKPVRCPLCSATFIAQPAAPTPPAAPVSPSRAVQPPAPVAPPRKPAPAADAVRAGPPPQQRQERVAPPAPAPREDFEPVRFKARVMKDDKSRLKGQLDTTWGPEGLELRQGKRTVLSVPVGSKADYPGGARLAVHLEERRLELAVGGPGTYQQRLAQDVADYLNGERSGPDPRGYTIPWYLFVPAVLPIGIPIFFGFGALSGALAGGLCGGCLALARVEKLPAFVRILLSLLLTGIGYAIILAIVLGGAFLRWVDQAKQQAAGPTTSMSGPVSQPNRPAPPPPQGQPAPPPPKPEPPKLLPGERRTVKAGEPVMYLELSPDGKTLATVSNKQTLKLWDADTGKERFAYAPGNGAGFIALLLISPDSRWVTAWDGRGPIEVRDMTGKVQARLDAGSNQAFYSYGSFSPDSKMLAVCTGERVRFWQVPDGKEPERLAQMIRTPGVTYTSAQFTPDGKTLITGASRGMERLDQVWDLAAAKLKGTFKGLDPKIGLGRLRLSPDGRLALMTTSRTAEVLDWAADRRVCLVAASGPDLAQVVFTPDSRHLLSLNVEGLVERWDIDSGKRVASFKSRSVALGGPATLAISHDGKTLITAATGEVTFWDAEEAFQAAPGK